MPIPLGVLAVAGAAAAGGGSAFDLLETQILGSDASSVTFTGLGAYSDYKHLHLRISSQVTSTGSSANRNLRMTFNGDSAANYNSHTIAAEIGSLFSYADLSQSATYIGKTSVVFGASHDNQFAPALVDILDFSNTNKFTTVRAMGGISASQDGDLLYQSSVWRNTAAITQFQIYPDVQSFKALSRFSLYGVK